MRPRHEAAPNHSHPCRAAGDCLAQRAETIGHKQKSRFNRRRVLLTGLYGAAIIGQPCSPAPCSALQPFAPASVTGIG